MTSAKITTDPTSSVLQTAYDYVARGWHVIQLHSVGPDGTCHCHRGKNCGKDGRSAGKHPIDDKWNAGEAPDADQVAEMWAKRPKANIGIATGSNSGFFVLDIDPEHGGLESAARLVAEHGRFPETRVVQTGSKGFHYFFQMPSFDVTNRDKWFSENGYDGIDIRGTGGQVVAPPSRSGKGDYVLLHDAPIAEAPAWLLEAVRPPERVVMQAAPVVPLVRTSRHEAYERSIVTKELQRLSDLARYGWDRPWDQTTYEVCCTLTELANADWSALTLAEAHDQIFQHAPRDPGFTDATVQAKWDSAQRSVGDKKRLPPPDRRSDDDLLGAAGNPDVRVDPTSGGAAPERPVADFPRRGLDDVGNAQRLVDRFGHRLRFAHDSEQWLTYTGGVWSDTVSSTALKAMAIATIEAAKKGESDEHSDVPTAFKKNGDPQPTAREEFHKWMAGSLMSPRLSAMLSWAEPDPRVAARMRDFDRDPMLLNAKNCVVNLTTGQVQPHAPELMMKHQTRIEYDPDAKAPKWEAFLERVQPDPEIRGYLQRVLGYSATGDMREQSFWIHTGPGATGKTTFLEVVQEIMGDYGQTVSRETLMASSAAIDGNAPSADIARMDGARFLATSETAAGKKLAEQKIKQLVGGDTYPVRQLYGKPYDMSPTGKIHMATNHLPGLSSGGDGLGRRIKIVGWDVKIPKEQQDRGLKDKILREEAAGVLAWLVRGAMLWFAEAGLTTPASVEARSEEHIRNADPLLQFMDERLAADPDAEIEHTKAYEEYETWAKRNGNYVMSGTKFSEGMAERGILRAHNGTTRRRIYKGVRLQLQVVQTHPSQGFFAEA